MLFGITIVGASQHGLGGVLHEATHFMLFRNRKLNDLAADWLAGFPLYTSIHHYRLYHLAHHQFINDPERDPDLIQLQMSGHALDFPMTHIEVLGKVLRLLWLPNLVRYTVSRAKSHSFRIRAQSLRDDLGRGLEVADHSQSAVLDRRADSGWSVPAYR